MSNTHHDLSRIHDSELIARTRNLVRKTRLATADLLVHLAEIDTRELYKAEACSSLYTYCTQVLHFSEGTTYKRIAAARAGRKFPLVLQMLAEGKIHLSAVSLLAPHLTEGNHERLLARAVHKSKREVQELVAEIAPKPPVKSLVRRVPLRTESTSAELSVADRAELTGNLLGPACGAETSRAVVPPASPTPAPASPSRVPVPLSPAHYRVQFTADPETVALLKQAQDLMRHQVPNGDPAVVFKRALQQLVAELQKVKHAQVQTPRNTAPTRAGRASDRNTRTIPAAVKRAVYARDRARCAFVSAAGQRCTETGFLEYHHQVPYARGGQATVENIALRCRAHNAYESRLEFGERWSATVREGGRAYQLSPGTVARCAEGAVRSATLHATAPTPPHATLHYSPPRLPHGWSRHLSSP